MPTGGDAQSIGKASVEINANIKPLEQGVDKAKEKVQEVGSATKDVKTEADRLWESMKKGADEAASAAEKTADSVASVGSNVDGVKNSVSNLTPEALLAAAAVAAIFYKVGQEIGDTLVELNTDFGQGAKSAEEFLSKIYTQKAETRLVALSEKISKLRKELGDAEEQRTIFNQPSTFLMKGRTEKAIKEELEPLEDAYKGTTLELARHREETLKKSDQKTSEDRQRQFEKDIKIFDRLTKDEEKFRSDDWLKANQDILDISKELTKEAEKRVQAEERAASIRLRGILDAQRETTRLFDMQSRAFGATDAGGSFSAQLEAISAEVRSLRTSMTGASE